MAVSDYERKIDKLRKDNEVYWEQLHDLQMEGDVEDEGKKKKPLQESGIDPEITELDEKIKFLRKDLDRVQEDNKKANMVND